IYKAKHTTVYAEVDGKYQPMSQAAADAKGLQYESGLKESDVRRDKTGNSMINEVQRKSWRDRKSRRLNSSHRTISYAVFWLKKKITNRSAEWWRHLSGLSCDAACFNERWCRGAQGRWRWGLAEGSVGEGRAVQSGTIGLFKV